MYCWRKTGGANHKCLHGNNNAARNQRGRGRQKRDDCNTTPARWRASHQATAADPRQDGRLANGANQTLAALGLLGDSESSDSSSQSEVEEPAERKIRDTGKAAHRRAKKHRQRAKWAAMCEDITDNMTVNSSNNGNAYVNKMIDKDCCSACGSGA